MRVQQLDLDVPPVSDPDSGRHRLERLSEPVRRLALVRQQWVRRRLQKDDRPHVGPFYHWIIALLRHRLRRPESRLLGDPQEGERYRTGFRGSSVW